MARHQIYIHQPAKQVMHTDISFVIHSNEAVLGELNISKGTIDWRAAGKRRSRRLSWEAFARLMEES